MVTLKMSYSQLNSYLSCGARFYYERVQRLPQTPSWAQVGGSAFHKMTELWDLAQMGDQGVTVDQIQPFEFYLEKQLEEERNRYEDAPFYEKDVRASGRASKAWPEKENKDWWLHHAPVFFQKWIDWRLMTNWEIWRGDDGTVGVEVGVTVALPDGTIVVMYIDRVFIQPTGFPVVVDLKSSSRNPKGSQQLGLYGWALNEVHGLPVEFGGYWMARTGHLDGELWPLETYTTERLAYEYGGIAENKKKGLYIASPGDFCGNCVGRDFCPAVGGRKAGEIDQPWEYKESAQ